MANESNVKRKEKRKKMGRNHVRRGVGGGLAASCFVSRSASRESRLRLPGKSGEVVRIRTKRGGLDLQDGNTVFSLVGWFLVSSIFLRQLLENRVSSRRIVDAAIIARWKRAALKIKERGRTFCFLREHRCISAVVLTIIISLRARAR